MGPEFIRVKHILVSPFSSWRQKFKVDKSNSVPALPPYRKRIVVFPVFVVAMVVSMILVVVVDVVVVPKTRI